MASRSEPGDKPLDRARAEALLLAAKDAGGAKVQWSEARSPVRGQLLSAQMALGVAADGDELVIRCEWRGPGDQQVRMLTPNGKGNLARLCLTPSHGDDLHWHFFEDIKGIREDRESVTHTVDKADTGFGTLFADVAAPRLKIVNFTLAEGMLR